MGVSTSGYPWKYPGRVGDSALPGAGNYADVRYGGAACTGRGELSMRALGARGIVADLARGLDPAEACLAMLADAATLPDEYRAELRCLALTPGRTARRGGGPERFRLRGDDRVLDRARVPPEEHAVKVFISSDMEGTAGVVDWDQCAAGRPEYAYYTRAAAGEVNAAIEGAMAAGATEFLVNDSHSTMANLRPDALAGRAGYLSGRHKPLYMMQGLDASFDAVFFVSYHGSMGSKAPVCRTPTTRGRSPRCGSTASVAGRGRHQLPGRRRLRVPVVLVTGDETTAEETERFCPGIKAAVVKRSVSRFSAESLHPAAARDLIRERARSAIEDLPTARQTAVSLPATLGISFRSSDYCELACRIAGVERTGDLSASITGDDPLRIYQTFITVVLLCRGLVE